MTPAPARCLACMLACWGVHAQASVQADTSTVQLKQLSIEELMSIEVTSVSKRPERLSETASAIQVIAADDIRRAGASSLPEALRLATNLEVAQVDSRRWAISARGLNTDTANQLLVMIDGRSLYTPRVAGVFWEVQDTLMEDIERIEVISGPGAALWGANAVNGVINITTRSAHDTQGLLFSGGAGNELRDFQSIRYGGTLGSTDFDYRFYAKHQERDGPVRPNGDDVAGGWWLNQGGFRIDGALSGSDTLTLQGDLYDGRYRAQNLNAIDARGRNLLARWSHEFSSSSALQLQLYYDFTHRDASNALSERLDTYDVDLQHHLAVGERHALTWGLGYRLYDNDLFDFGSNQRYIPAQRTSRLYSGLIQDQIELRRDWHLTLGSKFEHNDYTGFEFQPSIRLAWLLSPQQTLWGAISRAVRTPARADREQYQPRDPPYTRLGNDTFESEELLAYELGYRVQPTARVSASIAGFYDDYDKLRSVERVDPASPTPTMIGNGQQGRSYGVEISVDYRVTDWWRLHFGDTEIRIHIRPRPGSTDFSYGANESFDPEHQLSLRSSFDLPRDIQIDAAYRHISRIDHQNVPAYGELDLRLGWWVLHNLELSLTGRNLLHARHAEFGAVNNRSEIERSIYGKLMWKF